MQNTFITTSFSETQKLGEMLAGELRGGEVICLTGELGSGKTTFTQGALKGFGAKGQYTSPTFVVMKEYKIRNQVSGIRNIYHIDAYRVGPKDLLELGWEEIVSSKNNVVIVEWAERAKEIIPNNGVWIKFEHLKGDNRKIAFK